MKASDVATKLMLEVHKHTDVFSDSVAIASIQNETGICVVTTEEEHELTNNDPVFITNTQVPLQISSLTRAGTVGTLTTSLDHDLTLKVALTIKISGADDSNFNGTFTTLDIKNRRTITFQMLDSGATTTNNAVLESATRFDKSLNGLKRVISVLSPTVFTFNSGSNIDSYFEGGTVKKNLRVSASASIDRAIGAYTRQQSDKAWLFVVLGDTRASTDRNSRTDSVAEIPRGSEYRQIILETVGIFVFMNTPDEIAARRARDLMVDLLVAITRSIAFYKFPSSFYAGSANPLVFLNHTTGSYDGVLYMHGFFFESSSEMTFNDTVGYDNDVAFRQIVMSQFPDLNGTGSMDAIINLDTEAL